MPFQPGQPIAPKRPVAITGVGIVSPMGLGWNANAEGFRSGRTTFSDVTLFDTSGQRTGRAGQVDLPGSLPENRLSARDLTRLDRATRMLIHATAEALGSSSWDIPAGGLSDIPAVLGTSAGAMELGEEYFRQFHSGSGSRRGQASRIHHYQTQVQATTVARASGVSGPVTIITNACASGANAIGHAYRLVASGQAPRALAGGYDALCKLVFAGFDSLQALSTDIPRPFDAHRDGLALGEGAAVFTLEVLEEARARGATIYAEIAGYGAATDIHHLTQPDPEGSAACRTMTAACAEAGITPIQVDYINSHGTGTPLNDIAEANAIHQWAGGGASSVSVSSTKSSIGHLLGGAGAVESAICLMAMSGGWIPPSLNIRTPDPAVTFDLVTAPRKKQLDHVLTNSFGFGGANASLVFRRHS